MGKTDMIDSIVDYIEKNLDQDLSLDDIAAYAGYSKFYLSRCFQETVGCTVYRYIRMRRLTEAALKLTETEQPIIEIALAAGYQSQQAFTSAFRTLYVYSPQHYRLQQRFEPRMPRFVRNVSFTGALNSGYGIKAVCPAYAVQVMRAALMNQAVQQAAVFQQQMGGRMTA